MKEHTDVAERQKWMSLLAKSPKGSVPDALKALGEMPKHTWLRSPEIGSVMVQGRASGTGSPFNLGETTVTRCALKLECGAVGHAYLQGRRQKDAEAAAIVDALMQTKAAGAVRKTVLEPLAAAQKMTQRTRAEKAAATKVEFFTMVRGED